MFAHLPLYATFLLISCTLILSSLKECHLLSHLMLEQEPHFSVQGDIILSATVHSVHNCISCLLTSLLIHLELQCYDDWN